MLVIYFRVLKQGQGSALLPVALSGLEKNIHLVNYTIVADVVATLERLLLSNVPLTRLSAMHCISTGLHVAHTGSNIQY